MKDLNGNILIVDNKDDFKKRKGDILLLTLTFTHSGLIISENDISMAFTMDYFG